MQSWTLHAERAQYFLFILISTGYESLLFSRPDLFKLLLSKIPADKISLGCRVLKIEEQPDEDKIRVHCNDNNIHLADIVIGAGKQQQ